MSNLLLIISFEKSQVAEKLQDIENGFSMRIKLSIYLWYELNIRANI